MRILIIIFYFLLSPTSNTAKLGQQKLQQAAACDCNKVIADAKGTQAQLDKELTTTHPLNPPHDLVVGEVFWQEMSIESIDAPTTLLEPVLWPDVTNSLVMEHLAETHDLLDPYSDMDLLADEMETAIIETLWVHHRGVNTHIIIYVYFPVLPPKAMHCSTSWTPVGPYGSTV